MTGIIKENISIIITVLSFAVAGLTGYTTLRNDVTELQKNRVTLQEMTSVEKDVAELKTTMSESHIKTVHTTVEDMNREIDTLYLKAELALEKVSILKAEVYELRGRFNERSNPKSDDR